MWDERRKRRQRVLALNYFGYVEPPVMAPFAGEVVDGVVGSLLPVLFAWFFYKLDQV